MVSVAVCDTPAGRYEFYGYVHDKNGVRLGERPQDEPQFDPGVLTEGNRTYLYTGFCGRGDKFPKIMQDGRDGESIQTRGYCDGVVIIVPHRPPLGGGSREAGEGESLRQGSLPPRGGHNSGFFSSNCLVPCPLLWYNGHIVSENVRRVGKKSLCVAASHAEGVYV